MANGGRTVTSQLARSEVQIQSHLAAAGVRLKLSASSYVDLISPFEESFLSYTSIDRYKNPYGFGFLKTNSLMGVFCCLHAYIT